jgi:hypothetical protein
MRADGQYGRRENHDSMAIARLRDGLCTNAAACPGAIFNHH